MQATDLSKFIPDDVTWDSAVLLLEYPEEYKRARLLVQCSGKDEFMSISFNKCLSECLDLLAVYQGNGNTDYDAAVLLQSMKDTTASGSLYNREDLPADCDLAEWLAGK